jgi:hypothetical protein
MTLGSSLNSTSAPPRSTIQLAGKASPEINNAFPGAKTDDKDVILNKCDKSQAV